MNKDVIEDTMWTFLSMGGQKGNPELMNEYVQKLLRMTKQKNAGQKGYAKKDDISFDLIDPIKWSIICEAVALCLDERFPKLVELFKEEGENNDMPYLWKRSRHRSGGGGTKETKLLDELFVAVACNLHLRLNTADTFAYAQGQ